MTQEQQDRLRQAAAESATPDDFWLWDTSIVSQEKDE